MDQDFLDVTESNKKVGIIFVLIIAAILVFGYFFVYQKFHFSLKTIELELGETIEQDVQYYLKKEVVNSDGYKIDLTRVNSDEIGEYTYTVTYNNITKKGKIKVVDTTPPTFTLQEMSVEEGSEDYYLGDFLASCEDLSKPCLVTLKNEKDEKLFNEVGSHSIEVQISDIYGNNSAATATLHVIKKGEYVDPRTKDLEYASNSKKTEEFDGIYFKKLESAINPMSDDAGFEMSKVSAVDIEAYVKENHSGYELINSEIIELYNKSSFIIGYSILITIEKDGKTKEVYVDPEKVPANPLDSESEDTVDVESDNKEEKEE